MKKNLSLLIAVSMLLTVVFSTTGALAAAEVYAESDFSDFTTVNTVPAGLSGKMAFGNSGAAATFAPATGIADSAEGDVSLKISNPAGEVPSAQRNAFLGTAGYNLMNLQAGDKIQVRAKIAAGDDVANKAVEMMYFRNNESSGNGHNGGGAHPFLLMPNGNVVSMGQNAGWLERVQNRWYDINIIVTVGSPAAEEGGAAIPNKMELYVDGALFYTREFSLGTGANHAITGIRQIRIGNQIAALMTKDEAGKDVFPAVATYIDDFSVKLFKGEEQPFVPQIDIAVNDPTGNVSLAGVKARLFVSNLDTTKTNVLNVLTPPTGGSLDIVDRNYVSVDGLAPVRGNLLKITDTDGNVYYWSFVGQINYAVDNFNREIELNAALGGAGVTVARKAGATSYSEAGLGGRGEDDYSFVVKTTNYGGGEGQGDSYINYNGPKLTGVASFECSIYKDAPTASMTVTVVYTNTGGTASFYNPIVLDYDGFIKAGSAKVSIGRYEEQRWYKVACTVNTITGAVQVYLNGDLVHEQTLANVVDVNRLKAETRFPVAGAPHSGLGAYDDFKFYQGQYDNTENYISLESTASILEVDDGGRRVIVNSASMDKADFLAGLSTNAEVRIYDDGTLTTTEATEYGIFDGMVLVLESPNGESFKYYNIVTTATVAGIVASDFEYSNATEIISLDGGVLTAAELKAGITTYDGNTIKVLNPAGDELDDSDVVMPNAQVVISSAAQSKTYTVKIKGLLLDENFELWDDEETYYLGKQTVPAPWGLTIPSTETADSVKVNVVEEAGRGKVLKFWSEALTPQSNSNRHAVLGYTPRSGELTKTFVVEADVKTMISNNETQILCKYNDSKASNYAENYFRLASINNKILTTPAGTARIEEGQWYRISSVVDIPNNKIISYVDGLKIGELEIDLSGFVNITSVRLQHRFQEGNLRTDYFDNVRILEFETAAEYNIGSITTALSTSDSQMFIRAEGFNPVIKGAVGKTVAALKAAVTVPQGATMAVKNAGGTALLDTDVIEEGAVATVTSANTLNTVDYLFSSEMEVSPIEITINGTPAESLTAGTVRASSDIQRFKEGTEDVRMILGVYEGGKLVDIKVETVTVSDDETVYAELAVTSPAGKELRVFVWDGQNLMTPISEVSILPYVE